MAQAAKIELSKVEEPIKAPVTKFGGQPCWLEAPQWPVSRSLGTAMDFICQIALADVPGLPPDLSASGRIAYLFMTSSLDGKVVPSWDPGSGENAVIIQPGGRMVVATMNQAVNLPFRVFPEGAVRLTRQEEPELYSLEAKRLGVVSSDVYAPKGDNTLYELLDANKLGGVPCFIQHVEYPPDGGPWLFLLQLHEYNGVMEPNFGSGQAHAFISEDGREGRLLWQC